MKKILVCGMMLGLLTAVSWAQRGRTIGGGPYSRRCANLQRRDLASCRNESECDRPAARRSVLPSATKAKRSNQSEQESQHRETERDLRSQRHYGRFARGDQRSESSDPARRTHRARAGAMSIAGRDRAARGGRDDRSGGLAKDVSPLGVFRIAMGLTVARDTKSAAAAAPFKASGYRFFSSAFSMTSRET